jgi:hypothetical protein
MRAHWRARPSLFPLDVSISSLTFNVVASIDRIIVSATGAYACQLAKNVFRAGKVITTVSTAKVPKVREILGENVVDESKFAVLKITKRIYH